MLKTVPYTDPGLPEAPRTLDPAKSFQKLVDWVRRLVVEKNAPGLIVGISGTDSVLAFLACARAFELLGQSKRLVGVHYGATFPPEGKSPEEIERILNVSPQYRWVPRVLIPWLQQQAPQTQVLVDSSFDYNDDYSRWAALFRYSLNGTCKTEPLPGGENYWVVGTRNATEQALGAYSNISTAASLQPIMPLWKSEVLKICAYLGVPRIAIDQSRQVDCDCGRFEIAARHIEEVDAILMARQGLLSRQYLEKNILTNILPQLESFIDDQISYARFKGEIPYTPEADEI